jgi:oligopeptide transport system substrate-binding protein
MQKTHSLIIITSLILLAFIAIFLPLNVINTPFNDDSNFTMNLGTEPPTLDPGLASDVVSITVINNIYRGLVITDKYLKIKPEMAQTWELSADGKHYQFFLRKGLKWSDGKPLIAQDFYDGIQRNLNPKTAAPYAFFLFYIKNAKPYYDGKIKNFKTVGVKAIRATQLEFTLEAPCPFFTNLLATSVYFPIRKDLIQRYGDNFTEAKNFVGNGPYLLDDWKHEDHIKLSSNPNYWGKAPINKTVEMLMIAEPSTSLMMYESGELDFAETASSLPIKEVRRLKGRKDFHFLSLHGIAYIGFNITKPPINNPLIRKALALAIDKNYFPKLFQSGETPISNYISPGLTGYSPKTGLDFNPKQAQKLLAQAGYPNGKNFPKTSFWISASSAESNQLAEILQYQWKKNLNIDITVQRADFKVYLKQLSDDPPAIWRLQWYVDYPDPDSYLTVFISESGNNYTKWKNKQFDQWVKTAGQSLNTKQREILYTKAQQLLLEKDVALIPLYVIPKNYLLNPEKKGVFMSPMNLLTFE